MKMSEIEPNARPDPNSSGALVGSRKSIYGALWGLLAALPLAVGLWGYTVDDALITARVASHLAAGQGYRFNVPGRVSDAVTPLGFAHLLAAGGAAPTLSMLERARWLGILAWLAAAAFLGQLAARAEPHSARPSPALGLKPTTIAVLLVMALSAPLAAWAGSGMETGLVTALATLALAPSPGAALAAGLASAWRPELLPWALALGVGRALTTARLLPGRLVMALLLSAGPAILIAALRSHFFGSAAPLAVSAKPSDLSHGLRYALAGFVFTGAPLLLIAPDALARSDRETRVLTCAAAAHFGALSLAGGDWMSLYRLVVPVLPTILLAAVRLPKTRLTWLRLSSAAAVSLLVLVTTGLPARTVLGHRLSLIARGRSMVEHAHAVAALDAGWVGAATDAPVVDLAGVTDPIIAALPGGHTTKRIPEELLRARGADVWVLLLAPGAVVESDWQASEFARGVEQRLSRL
ncbi:MAG TPA: hypothetical protein VGP93_07080, partial [Polyangiaceae bacterium]|nr:hypothetical protein [Polyangiaceae bacterium]